MSNRNRFWVDPQDDDTSDAGDPDEAGQKFLESLTPEAREALTEAGPAEAGPNVPSPSADELPPDGPQPRGKFSWHGQSCDFSSAEYRYKLLEALWDSKSKKPYAERDVGEVVDAVYGKD